MDFENVAVGVVEIGRAAGEHAAFPALDEEGCGAVRSERFNGAVEGLGRHAERMMDRGVRLLRRAGLAPGQNDMIGPALEEDQTRPAVDDLHAEHVRIEGRAALDVAHPDAEMNLTYPVYTHTH